MSDRSEALALARQLPKRITEFSPLARDAVTLARALLDCEQERQLMSQVAERRKDEGDRADAAEARVLSLEEALREWERIFPAHRAECLFLTERGCTCGLENAHRLARAVLSEEEK